MPKLINPNKLTNQEATDLYLFLESQRQISVAVWKKNTVYSISNIKYQFSHDVVQRARKDGKTGFRYEFISDRVLGKGTYGRVFDVEGRLALDQNKLTYTRYGYEGKKNQGKKYRVVKVQSPRENKELESERKRVEEEYQLSIKAGHLGIKKPTFRGETSYTVMKKLPGKELYKIMVDDYRGITVLSLRKRLNLTKALLKALNDQVIKQGIIHRDIKCENILVDMREPISVNILDYGLSIEANKADGKQAGSRKYMAPEAYTGEMPTPAMDLFSMAIVLALIWRVDLNSFISAEQLGDATKLNLNSLFSDIKGLNQANQEIIRSTLKAMLAPKNTDRPSIDEVIAKFDRIMTNEQIALHIKSQKRLAMVLRKIKSLRIKADELDDRKEFLAGGAMRDLATGLEDELRLLQAKEPLDYSKSIRASIESCQRLIISSRTELKKHRNSNYIIAEVALGVVGLGIGYGVAILINKAFTGHYRFFVETKSCQLIKEVEQNLICSSIV